MAKEDQEGVRVRGAFVKAFRHTLGLGKLRLYSEAGISPHTLKRIEGSERVRLASVQALATAMTEIIRVTGVDDPRVLAFLTENAVRPAISTLDLLANRPQSPTDILPEKRRRHLATPWRWITWWDPTDYSRQYPKDDSTTFPFDRPNRRMIYWHALHNSGAIWLEQNLYKIDPDGVEVWLTAAHTWFQVPILHFSSILGQRGYVFRRLDTYESNEGGLRLDHIFEFLFLQDARHFVKAKPEFSLRGYCGQDHIYMRRIPVSHGMPIDHAGALHLHGPQFAITGSHIVDIGTDTSRLDPDLGVFLRME